MKRDILRANENLYVAGIRASAGDLEPLRDLVTSLPLTNENLAVIVMQYSGAEAYKDLNKLMEATGIWSVQEVQNEVPLKAGTVYLTPAGHNVILNNNTISPKPQLKGEGTPKILTTADGTEKLLIIFEQPDLISPGRASDQTEDDSQQSAKTKKLEQKLKTAKERLQAFTEELETSNEELQAANEELIASNEELQSANTELQATIQKLEKANEVLTAKENELQKAKDELELTGERFEMALSNSNVFIGYQDNTLRYYWHHNRSVHFNDNIIVGKTDLELLGNDGAKLQDTKSKVLHTGKEYNGEIDFGNGCWEVSIKPIEVNGKITGVKTLAIDVSERRKANREKQQKQGIINGIIEESNYGILVIDPYFNILTLNKFQQTEFQQRFGRPMNEGDNLLELLDEHPQVRDRLKEVFIKALSGEKVHVDRYRSLKKSQNGITAYYNIQLYPLWNDDEQIIGAALMSSNITHQVKVEEQIQYIIKNTANLTDNDFFDNLTEQMYRLFRAKYIYFAEYRPATETLESKAYRINGELASPISFKLECTPSSPAIKGREAMYFKNVSEEFYDDARLKAWNAREYFGIPITSPTTGEILGIFVMIHDDELEDIFSMEYLFNVIALRAGAELETMHNLSTIKSRDKQLLNITRNIPEMIYEYIATPLGKDDQFTFVSEAAESIYEISSAELMQNPHLAWKSIYAEDQESFNEKMKRSSEDLTTLSWTGRIVGRDTYKLRWVKITARPEKLEDDSIIIWYGTINDISRIKHIEQELQHAKKIAEENALAKEEFLATMSHEIRTPLNGIVGITDIMISEASADQMEYLSLLKFSAENLMTLINNILDFSKINAGQIDVSEANIHLKILLKNLKHSHMYRARENGNELNFIVDKKIPDMVRGDDMILLQILNNLLGNAVKFTRAGEVELSLMLEKDGLDKVDIRFEVRDTGVGIAEKDLERIFDKFRQVGDRSQNSGGTGLGLAIARKLIEILGSQLEVKSELGKGSSFYFTLSLKKAFFDKKKDAYSIQEHIMPELKKTVNILLVEDVEENKNMLLRYFKKTEQLSVDAASNGKEAVDMVLNKDYDLVLMDLRMPVMDGREATAIIRSWENEKYRKLPIIALTADVFDATKETNFTDVITKPFSPRELKSKIIEYANSGNSDPK